MASAPAFTESARLQALHSCAILDTPPEAAFDQLAVLAASVLDAPMALIGFVDERRQWLKAAVGLPLREWDRTMAFCPRWLDGRREPVVVPDTLQDPVCAAHPLVLGPPGIRFYACAPLVTAEGLPLGTIAVLDTRPHTPRPDQLQALAILAQQALALLALRQQQGELEQLQHERERMQSRLLTQTETLRVAGRIARVGGWIVDLPGLELAWSDDIAVPFGLTRQAPTLRKALRLYAPGYREPLRRAFAACLREGHPFDIEALAQVPGRAPIWLRTVGQAVHDAEGRTVRIQGAFQDITERHEADMARRVSDERFHLVARATTDTVWDWDVQTNALWWSDSFRAMLGMPGDAPIPDAEAYADRLHPDDRQRVLRSLFATARGADATWQAEYRLRHDAGHYIWILDRGFVIRDAQDRALRMVGGMSNISARKQADLEAQQEALIHAELVRVQQRMSVLSMPLEEVLALVAQTALHSSGATGAMVEMLDGDRLVSQASAGQMVRPAGAALPLQDSLLWAELRQDRTVLCNDIQGAGWQLGRNYARVGVRAALAVPLHVGGAVVGAIKLTSERTGVFGQRNVAHLQILAESLGAMVQLRQVADRLQASQQQYKLLFDAHPQPMWVYALDESLRFLAVNQAMQALYGYGADELLRMSVHDLWLPHQRARLHDEVTAIAHEARRDGVMARHRRKDGTVMDLEMSSRGILFNGVLARQVMATDVTERLRTQRELARMARAQQMLSSCNEALVRATSEAALLQSICRIVVDTGGYGLGWVGFTRDDAQKSIEIVAHAGGPGAYLDSLCVSWSEVDRDGQGPAGVAVRTGKPVIVRDVHNDPVFTGLPESLPAYGLQGVICLPLRTARQTFGLLHLCATEVLHIGPEESALLQELAADLAFGIMGLRARQEQQQLQASVLKMAAAVSASTGTEFFEQLARNMSEALGAQMGVVARLLPPRPGGGARVATLALVRHGELLPNIEYDLEKTPSRQLLTQRQFVITHGLALRYPEAPIVARLQAQGYAGQQLCSSTGEPTGMIFVMFRQPLANADFVSTTLQIFATRASAEIERQVTDARLRHQASLLDKAQDAIVVRDLEHRITYWNQSAELAYGWPREEALGQTVESLLYPDASAFLRATSSVLAQGEWAGEIVQHDRGGEAIDMEGRWTLVRNDEGQPESILEINTDIRQRKATDREIQRLAFYDTLTGLPNRMLLLDRMQQALGAAQRQQQGGALLFIDLDNFKTLNDTLGHDKGDLLLQQVGQRLNACVRGVDTVARLGGDEFVVMLEGLSADPDALALETRAVGEKVLAALSAPYDLGGYHYRSTPSIGIAPFLGDQTSVGDLLKQADLAMYQAKTAGRNTLRFFDPHMQAVVTARAALESDLRTALVQNQFLLYFQPQVDAARQYVGVEALLRWTHPEKGPIPPAQFIPLAEETGLILTLGRWVLHTACKTLARWQGDPVLGHLSMAVNVSSRQFRNNSFVDDVAHALAVNEAPAQLLKLELTESLLVEDMDVAISTMAALRQLGVGFALDDFGTGYSSLSYLKRMPLHQIKIDQSFVRDLLTDPNDAAIVDTIIALSASLGLEVIAEGVETDEQHALLLAAGCTCFQGYLFGRPLPLEAVEPLLRLPVS